ncbi:hypothetical protein K0M31_017643 [Melipona bicolor]|uniref:Uncharacterized protein n=1 Tax=Melipona bicolor TaxID=60889 RepID=A0AA40G595_9HYME|nr:hypothetical protein K0M31_017643 [Melipona bicolor]
MSPAGRIKRFSIFVRSSARRKIPLPRVCNVYSRADNATDRSINGGNSLNAAANSPLFLLAGPNRYILTLGKFPRQTDDIPEIPANTISQKLTPGNLGPGVPLASCQKPSQFSACPSVDPSKRNTPRDPCYRTGSGVGQSGPGVDLRATLVGRILERDRGYDPLFGPGQPVAEDRLAHGRRVAGPPYTAHP